MKRRLLRVSVIVAMMASPAAFASEPGPDHAAWDTLLRRYVDEQGQVNYRAWHEEGRQALEVYLQRRAETDVSRLAKEEALAFWINAYNACVVQGVLEHYLPAPSKARQAGPIASVKEVKGFFDRIRYRVASRELTLNEIEGQGRALGDWRIHFAVVCAATGCPVLRSEAYMAERVGAQLDEQISRYLVDDVHGMRIDYASKTLWVSKIFKWYAKDFVSGPLTTKSLWAVIGGFVPQQKSLLWEPEQFNLKFLDYDWSLNAQLR